MWKLRPKKEKMKEHLVYHATEEKPGNEIVWQSRHFVPVPELPPYSFPDSQTQSITEEITRKVQYITKHGKSDDKSIHTVNHHSLLVATYENAWPVVV